MASKENLSAPIHLGKARYRDGLNTITRARYFEKIKEIDDIDPYELDKNEWSSNMTKWPEVTYPDIVNYLVYNQSAYTLAELKAYKSLDAYNYFVSGFVQEIGHKIINGRSVFLGKVKHSQRMSDPSLQPWLIVANDGSVSSGHCTCMAGIGEVCSHIGALLFAIEAAVKVRNSKTVTEEKAYWMLPNVVKKIEYKRVQDIDFTSAKSKKKKLDEAIEEDAPLPSGPRQRKLPTVQEPTSEELKDFYKNLCNADTKPVLLSLVPQFAETYRPKALDRKYPSVLSELYSEDNLSVERDDILKQCQDILPTLTVSEEEAANCEFATREQANCRQWFNFRLGRITASRAKRVCTTSQETPAKSLIKDICYPMSRKFSTKATEWGCDHEKNARQKYICEMSKTHTNFHIKDVGFFINPKFPYIGASPDGIASCDCCGDVLIEIKCPYCQRNSSVSDSIDCLITVNETLELSKSHSYYYQVQCQLLVTGKDFCDFIVWTKEDFFLERISKDPIRCLEITEKSQHFFQNVILPELVGKIYTRSLQESSAPADHSYSKDLICTCQRAYDEDFDNVIGCDGENCPFQWLHFRCAGIKSVPKGKWLCQHCKKI